MVIFIALYLLLLLAPPVAFGLTLWMWWKSSPRFEPPKWRSYLGFGGFSSCGASVLLFLFLAIWARIRSGFQFYEPVLLRCYGVGFLLGLGGFLLGLIGKGKLRWPALVISFAMIFLWLVSAASE